MAITSASTQADIVGEYLDNLSYDINGSTSQAAAFIAACRALLVMHPSDWQHNQSRITYTPQLWNQQLQAAMAWYSARSAGTGGGAATHLAFQEFRG